LTSRQVQILRMVADDMTDTQVAEGLHLSPSTVMTHMKSIRKALGTRTRAGAVAKAFRLGILDGRELLTFMQVVHLVDVDGGLRAVVHCTCTQTTKGHTRCG
jgi:DNA-binding CsgD family transcriptional regulator